MSNLESHDRVQDEIAHPPLESIPPRPTLLSPRMVKLTTRSGVAVERTLPHRDLKRIGAWCFLDSYGPTSEQSAMSVAAHPHTGLQTVTWLFSGKVLHHDALGTKSEIRPGELNLMTAGYGISHSELSLESEEPLHGVQLWVALPEAERNRLPSFHHYKELPVFVMDRVQIKLFMGELWGQRSPALTFSPLVGAEIEITSGALEIPLHERWEYGFLVISGEAQIDDRNVTRGELFYLPPGKIKVNLESTGTTKVILLGGEPFKEQIIMWWNFIGRTHEEIVEMRRAWESNRERFPTFENPLGAPIPAPEMPNLRLTPR